MTTTISALPAATALNGSEVLPGDQTGTTNKISSALLQVLATDQTVGLVSVANIASLSGAQTVDGVLGTAGSTRVLLTAQLTASQNGPWTMQAGAWTRPLWYTSGNTVQAFQFLTLFARLGTVYAGSFWDMTAAGTITIDTTATTWVQKPIANGALAQAPTLTLKGNNTGVTATIADLTVAQVQAMLNVPPGSNVQIFTSSGTWTAPATINGKVPQTVRVVLLGPGGGGGGGALELSGVAASGGGGGGGGCYQDVTILAANAGASQAITIGSVGAAGVGATVSTTAGGNGSAGGFTVFGSLYGVGGGGGGAGGQLAATGSGGGAGGQIRGGNGGNGSGASGGSNANGTGLSGNGGSAVNASNYINIWGGAGGGGCSATGVHGDGASATQGGGGGGSGGGVSAALGSNNGGSGALSYSYNLNTFSSGGTVGSINGVAGNSTAGLYIPTNGGGGGYGNASGVAGNGGAGGWGSGGGGGGTALNGSTSGNGGAGGPGFVIVVTSY